VALIHEDQGVGGDVWIYDLTRSTLTRLTFEGNNAGALWTPDGRRVVYRSQRAGVRNLFWKLADGTGSEEQLTNREDNRLNSPTSVSPDGEFLIYADSSRNTGRDIWMVPLEGDRKPSVFLQSPFEDHVGKISPDGRWLAYVSNESGRFEVYVRPFPSSSGRWQISTEGGAEPLWSRDGRELFYRIGNKVMVVNISPGPSFQAGTPRLLFERRLAVRTGGNSINTNYDISPDGRRFLMVQEAVQQAEAPPTQIHVVLNWFEELKRRVPTR
jgi:serine/threonine-protein kinase